MSLFDNFVAKFLEKGILSSKQQITPGTWHLRLQLSGPPLAYIPGQHLRVFIGHGQSSAFRDMVRTYSIWHYDEHRQIVEIAVCTFSEGPGAQWVRAVTPGDEVYFRGPEGRFTVDTSGDFYLLFGDPSSFAHLYELNRHLPGKAVHGLLYAEHNDYFFADLDGTHPLAFTTLPENPGAQLIDAVTAMRGTATGKGIAYIAGDGRTCVTLSKHFRKLGWSSRQIKTKPFWMPGKKGLE